MDPRIGLAIVLAIAVLAVVAMLVGWRRRRTRDAALQAPLGAFPDEDATATAEGLYVATTAHDDKLNRLAVPGMEYRSSAGIAVAPHGVMLTGVGAYSILIPAADLVAVDRASFTVDRVVEKDGLVMIAWRIEPGTIVDTYLRLQSTDSSHLIEAIDELIAQTPVTGTPA